MCATTIAHIFLKKRYIMRKILISDYDNTFYINDDDIKNNMKKVKKFRDKNNIFAIATGRSYDDFNRKLKEYPIKFDYLIINQGATILDSKGNIIENYIIDNNIKNNLIEDLELKDQDTMFACSLLESRVSIKNNKITKVHKKYETLDIAKKMNEMINERYSKYIISYLITSVNAIEIISSKTNKANAINKIAKIENIKKRDIFTVGDSYNDIEMIENFNGFCVTNSEKEIKDISIKEYNSVSELIDELLGEKNEQL